MRLVDWLHRRRDRQDPIDALIAERGARIRFEGFDPDLRERTDEKRKQAERFAKASRRVSSSPMSEARDGQIRRVR